MRTAAILVAASALLLADVALTRADPGPSPGFEAAKAAAFGDMNVYFGNLHSHTGYSDGEGYPQWCYEWARDEAGFDFYAVTDHAEKLTDLEWSDTGSWADRTNADGTFVALRGFEWSGADGHVNVFGTAGFTDAHESRSLESLYRWLHSNAGFAQFNHPADNHGTFEDFTYHGDATRNDMRLQETGNAGAGNADEFFYGYFLMSLDNGWMVAPTSNQDNHSLHAYPHRTAVVCPSLTRASIMDALMKKRLYSTDDPNMEVAFKCGEDWMGSTIYPPSGRVRFDATVKDDENIEKVELVTNKGVVADSISYPEGTDSRTLSWSPTVAFAGDAYYFLRVTERDTLDGEGKQVALTAPIWLRASPTWYLAEGSTMDGLETWVLVQNPNDNDVSVDFTFMTDKGPVVPEALQGVLVPAGSRRSFNIGTYVQAYDVSTKVESSGGGVICERAVYGSDRTWGHDSVGATSTSPTWYLAEGSTSEGMETWVLVQNPNPDDVTVDLTLMTQGGPVEPGALQGVVVPAGTRRSFNIGAFVQTTNVSTRVESSGGGVVCERAMYGNNRTWGHDSVGATQPHSTWYLAEGSTTDGLETWILVQNPNSSDVTVDLTLMTDRGPVTPEGLRGATVPAGSRRTFNIGTYVQAYDVSTKVESSGGGVVCERAMYGNARAWGHDSVGVAGTFSTWDLAEGSTSEGMETWVLVQNPNPNEVAVDLTLMTDGGKVAPEALRGVVIPGGSRRTFNIGAYVQTTDVSTKVVSVGGDVICERAVYGPGRTWGTVSIGSTEDI